MYQDNTATITDQATVDALTALRGMVELFEAVCIAFKMNPAMNDQYNQDVKVLAEAGA